MIRTFRYPLRPTKAQESILESWLVACQQLYNGALEERKEAWRKQNVSLSLFGQQKELTELRAADPEWAAIPMMVERSALRRLNCAFRNFFRRVKVGQTPGYPRFRSRERYTSFDLGDNAAAQIILGRGLRLGQLTEASKGQSRNGIVFPVQVEST